MSHIIETSAQLHAALDRGESLGARWYTDPAITESEFAHIFNKAWGYAGSLDRLRNVGDYLTATVGRVPVVVLRNQRGLAAFVNVCRHRRHEVMKGCGNMRMMQCAYHAWTYDLAGNLKSAPRSAGEPGFRMEDFPLLPARVETLGPFVFVNLDAGAAPLASHFAPLLDIVAASGIDLDGLSFHSRNDWESHSNWKTMLENYLECYHCPVAHPSFSAAIDVRAENYALTAHGWFSSQVGQVRPSALEGKSKVKLYDVAGEVTQSQFHLLWPNTTININPGFPNLSIDVWIPDGPNATRGVSEQFFAPGVSEEFARDLIAFNKEVAAEDDKLTDSVQRGLLAGLPERGRFLTGSEHLVVHFQRMVVDAVVGQPASRAPVKQEVSRLVPAEWKKL
jgi:choline monooxygenase